MQDVFNKIGSPEGKNILNKANAINSDIIKTINKNVPTAVIQCKTIAKKFEGNTELETCRNIWEFLKTKIQYKKDPAAAQMVRLPRRFLRDGKGDCKSFALFTAGVLGALGIPFKIRYAGYNSGIKIPSHVYVITDNGIIIDAVWHRFNDEKEPKFLKDMKVYTLAGLDNVRYSPVNGLFKKKSKEEKKERKEKRKGKVNKIVLAPSRAAFLGLVLINFHGLASKLASGLQKNSDRIQKLWKKLGGDFGQLKSTIDKGAQKKRIFGIGSPAAAAAAAITTAAPIIVIVVKELKQLGLGGKEVDDLNDQATDELKDQGTDPDTVSKQIEAGADNGFSFTPSTGLLFAGGAAVLLIFGKKLFKGK